MNKILKQQDIKKFRDKCVQDQGFKDPITEEKLTFENAQGDHDHQLGHMRMALTKESNMLLGKIENYHKKFIKYKNLSKSLSDILRSIAWYLELSYGFNPIHPTYVQILISRFSRLPKFKQLKILRENKIKYNKKIQKKAIVKLYKKWVLHDDNIYKF
jgi:hypothetical protein